MAVTMDTSRDESSAEVGLFLDGQRVGSGTCRFNKVRKRMIIRKYRTDSPGGYLDRSGG